MTDEERIKYYMGKWRDTEITLKKCDFKEFKGWGRIFITRRKNILDPFYMSYVDRKSHIPHLKLSDLHYLMMLGDRRLSKNLY